jgi:lipopolysaccharide transport system ATP-binding protein
MDRPVISVDGLSKRYLLGTMAGHDTLRDHLTHGAQALWRTLRGAPKAGKNGADDFWALRDVSFELGQGEVLGVVGRNGAGKSTLLKLLSQITEPTEGEIRIRGRVASLLEVGTGFHPELTGRENVYLNGAVLGMSRREIRGRFDEIVAFAEMEKFLDTPVKRYSSGMYVRLAFAVAAHLEPEILIVDEVLAVGDAAFQKKCLGKMSGVARTGRTILFVSHNLSAVQRLCTRGLYLDKGRVQCAGSIETVLDAYQRSMEEHPAKAVDNAEDDRPFQFLGWELQGDARTDKHTCYTREECVMSFRLRARRPVADAYVGFGIWNNEGELIVAGQSRDEQQPLYAIEPGLHDLTVTVRLPIKAGLYQIDISLNSAAEGQLERALIEPRLHILPQLDTNLPERWHGILSEPVRMRLSSVPAAATTP